jgi:cob(I)alamin adenosyltransferase
MRGLIHVYTGNGKGKTSAALGLCIRACGAGMKCCFIQFLKGIPSSETAALKDLKNFELYVMGRRDFNFQITPEDKKRAEEAFLLAKEKAKEDFNVMVLDEINVAVHLGLIEERELLSFLKEKPKELELVLTGRYARGSIIEAADYVTRFELIKHPYYGGTAARRGIDY